MMVDMGEMVTQQGEQIDAVEVQVDATRDSVVAGNRDLERAAEYQASFRKKVCIAVLCVIALLAAIIIPTVIHYLPSAFSGGGGGGGAPSPTFGALPSPRLAPAR